MNADPEALKIQLYAWLESGMGSMNTGKTQETIFL